MQGSTAASNPVTDIDPGGKARILLGAFDTGVAAYELGNKRLAKLAREIIFELIDMSLSHEMHSSQQCQALENTL